MSLLNDVPAVRLHHPSLHQTEPWRLRRGGIAADRDREGAYGLDLWSPNDGEKGKLSPRTVKHIIDTLRTICRWAVRMGILAPTEPKRSGARGFGSVLARNLSQSNGTCLAHGGPTAGPRRGTMHRRRKSERRGTLEVKSSPGWQLGGTRKRAHNPAVRGADLSREGASAARRKMGRWHETGFGFWTATYT
jgi:hypothetical protein